MLTSVARFAHHSAAMANERHFSLATASAPHSGEQKAMINELRSKLAVGTASDRRMTLIWTAFTRVSRIFTDAADVLAHITVMATV